MQSNEENRRKNEDVGLRVLRGGSWADNNDYARAVFRLNFAPGYRYYDFGFRVVVVRLLATK